MRHYLRCCSYVLLALCVVNCAHPPKERVTEDTTSLLFDSSNKELVTAFNWAKDKALSYAHDNTDPVGYWYEAALPNREAFCMRDVSHQAIGAELLGLGKHNYNMFLKFAQNISVEKDYCTYWEINRYDKPAPVDYENDTDFWYNLPSNLDLTYSAYRLYNWTGNADYLQNHDLKNFYAQSVNEYIDHWQLGFDKIASRNRLLHLAEDLTNNRFKNKRGIPTYNEGGRGETLIGIDMTASIIAAYKAYADIALLNGDTKESNKYLEKAKREQAFLDEFWWDQQKQEYKTILYEDETFDYFMVGNNQAFSHYLLYFDAIDDAQKVKRIVNLYEANFDKLIVELKSYLPIIFYENGKTHMANDMIIDLCSPTNKRRDYPENSFTVIEHLTRGLMGVNVDAKSNTFSTISRLEKGSNWAQLENIPMISNKVTVAHYGTSKTVATHISGSPINWLVQMLGNYDYFYVNGIKTKCMTNQIDGLTYSFATIELNAGDKVIVTNHP